MFYAVEGRQQKQPHILSGHIEQYCGSKAKKFQQAHFRCTQVSFLVATMFNFMTLSIKNNIYFVCENAKKKKKKKNVNKFNPSSSNFCIVLEGTKGYPVCVIGK